VILKKKKKKKVGECPGGEFSLGESTAAEEYIAAGKIPRRRNISRRGKYRGGGSTLGKGMPRRGVDSW
jgi:hypothetical protein